MARPRSELWNIVQKLKIDELSIYFLKLDSPQLSRIGLNWEYCMGQTNHPIEIGNALNGPILAARAAFTKGKGAFGRSADASGTSTTASFKNADVKFAAPCCAR